MAILVTKDNSGGGGHVDPTVYKAMVTNVELIDDPKKAKHGPFLAWSFRIKDPMHDGEPVDDDVTINGACSAKLSDKSKLNKWLKSMGISVEDGEEVDVESGVGKVVMVQIIDHEREDMVYSRVVDVMPAPKKKKDDSKPAKKKKKEEDDTPPPEDDPVDAEYDSAEDDSAEDAGGDDDDDLFGDFDDD